CRPVQARTLSRNSPLPVLCRGRHPLHLRKITKNRGAFPSDDALLKLFYLALQNISQKWTMPIRDWKVVLNRFIIQFDERMPQR
ncbi:hypothetical protein AB4094_06490, partial [Acidithiobacillus ferrianus]